MFRIRYYSETFEPRQFGRFIRFLNWVRYWLETFIQYLILRKTLKDAKASKQVRAEFVTQFKKDVQAEVAEWEKTTTHKEVIEKIIVDSRYKVDGGQRPVQVDDMLARHLAPARSKRYAASKDLVTDRDVNEDFEPSETQNEQQQRAASDGSDTGSEDGDGRGTRKRRYEYRR